MTSYSRDAVIKLARRIVDDPRIATVDSARILAKGILMLIGERLR
jgi:hypothetical protein